MEKEPRSLSDVNALVQTMELEKFKFVDNRFLNERRTKERVDTLVYLKGTEKKKKRITRKVEPKYKYISRLLLYNSKLKNASVMSYNKGENALKGADMLACNPDWPLCLYDHTYKSRCISYFAFRSGGPCEFRDDYFEEEGKEKVPDLDQEQRAFDGLLIERNRHYCTNEEFVTKMNKLLEQEGNVEAAFPSVLIEPGAGDELSLMLVMENYVDHILSIDEKAAMPGGTREVDLGTGYEDTAAVAAASHDADKEEDTKDAAAPNKIRAMSQHGEEAERGSEGADASEERAEKMAGFNRTVMPGCYGKLMENMTEFYNRRAIPLSFYMTDMASRMPFVNSEDIVARSPTGKLISSIIQSQVNI